MIVYWFGYGGSSNLAEELRPVIIELGMQLVTIHEHENANIKWERTTWLNELKKADIIILPADYKIHPAKSNNRLTQALSLGKPVICSPLDAYIQIAKKYPGSFMFADTQEEWKNKLTLLKDNPPLREELSKKAIEASKDYSIDAIGQRWADLLMESEDSVDIVIPTYNNLRCLKLCIDSIRICTEETPYKIIVVNNGSDESVHEYLSQPASDIKYIKTGRRLNFSQAINTGIKAGSSKYVCIQNDDTIVSRGWLKEMIQAYKSGIGAVGPLSNCDKTWLHSYNIMIGGVDLLPGLNSYEQILPIVKEIYEYQSIYSESPEREWVAFYCTLISRKVIEEVGFLDEKFTNSGEDVDYCKRIKMQGYKIIQTYKSFCFHFGAVGRALLEKENYEAYHEADKKTTEYLSEKWKNKTVVLYSGLSWERWDHRNVDIGGIGGSETWQIWLARELAKFGYRVLSFCDCPESGIKDPYSNVEYRHYMEWPKFTQENWIDYLILSRTVDPLDIPVRAGKVFIQIHDVFLMSDRYKLHMDKVTKYCVLSQWHWDFVKDYHKIPDEKLARTTNGIDFKRFDEIQIERHPHRLMWSSSWDRGLDNVFYLLPFIREKIPDVELHIFYGIGNWKKSCLMKNDQEGLKKIEFLENEIKTQPNVFNHDRLNQKQLAVEWFKSSLLFYPGWFSETFFIGGIEAQKAGVPVIANKYAGIISTIGDSGILIGDGSSHYPYTKEGREKFLEAALNILMNKDQWDLWSMRGLENVKKYSWETVALRWKELFEGEN